MFRRRATLRASAMWRCAILLPTPREPECRNSHTAHSSSTQTSIKWLPEPSDPSCSSQFAAYRAGLKPALAAILRSSASRGPAVAEVLGQFRPHELGAHGDHAAADVHAHGRRDDGAYRGDDGPHRGALAEVGVG